MHNHTHTNTAEQQRLVTRCDVMWRYELVCVRVYRCGVSTDVSGSLFLHLERSSYWLRWRRDVTPPTANTHARTHMYIFIFFFHCTFPSTIFEYFPTFSTNYSVLVCIFFDSQNTSLLSLLLFVVGIEAHAHVRKHKVKEKVIGYKRTQKHTNTHKHTHKSLVRERLHNRRSWRHGVTSFAAAGWAREKGWESGRMRALGSRSDVSVIYTEKVG